MNFIRLVLILGLAGGVVLTAVGLIEQPKNAVPADSVATVNGKPISLDLYRIVVQGAEADREGKPLSPDERSKVLDRMVEEELLVQQAVSVGLASHDRMARGYLVQAMIEFVTQGISDEKPSDEELQSFFEKERARFTRPGKIAIEAMFFDVFTGQPDQPAFEKAKLAGEELKNGAEWGATAKKYADEPVIKLPRTPMGPTNVLEYLGPSATRAAFTQPLSAIGEPVRTQTGYVLLRVNQKWDDAVAPFETVREDVLAEWRHKKIDAALREYVDGLRGDADIKIHSGAVAQ